MIVQKSLFTFLCEHNLEHIAIFGEDLIERVNLYGIDNVAEYTLDHTIVSAEHARVLELLGQLYGI